MDGAWPARLSFDQQLVGHLGSPRRNQRRGRAQSLQVGQHRGLPGLGQMGSRGVVAGLQVRRTGLVGLVLPRGLMARPSEPVILGMPLDRHQGRLGVVSLPRHRPGVFMALGRDRVFWISSSPSLWSRGRYRLP